MNRAPPEGPDEIAGQEAAVTHVQRAGGERGSCAAAGEEGCSDDQHHAPLPQLVARPLEACSRLIAAKQPARGPTPEVVSQEVGEVVARVAPRKPAATTSTIDRSASAATMAAVIVAASPGTTGKKASIATTAKTIR